MTDYTTPATTQTATAADGTTVTVSIPPIKVTVPPPVVVPPPPPPIDPPPVGQALFVGDYSPGDFRQWDVLQCRGYNGAAKNYPATGNYQASIVSDATYGKAARWEVRAGDNPGFSPGSERAEVQSGNVTGGASGTTRWYRLAAKFDANFPKNHASLGWGCTHQWHPNLDLSSPWVAWHVDVTNGKWSLTMNPQPRVGTYTGQFPIWEVPLGTAWHDVKMQIKWSTGNDGFIKLWYNGVAQTFLVGGTTTYTAPNMIPGDPGAYYKEGYYRKAMSPTGILYTTGFRCAATEAGVG